MSGQGVGAAIGCGAVAVIVALCGMATCASKGCMATYSSGERSGTINKISKRGVLWKSWEGQMSLGGQGGGAVANVWDFSMIDDELAEELQRRAESGERATVFYDQWLIGPVWLETHYNAKGVKQP